ncbi:MAG: hypothetical protein ACKOK8_07765, partial [Planctomycetia bacterium]
AAGAGPPHVARRADPDSGGSSRAMKTSSGSVRRLGMHCCRLAVVAALVWLVHAETVKRA